MPEDKNTRKVQIRGGLDGPLLAVLSIGSMVLEFKKGGVIYRVNLADLVNFSFSSERIVFRAEQIYDVNSEDPVKGIFE